MEKYIYGIDFGTSNSTLAILNVEENEIVKVFTTPSLLFFPSYQKFDDLAFFVGHKAIKKYVAARMEGRFMKSIKRVLPNKSFTQTKLANHYLKAEDLVAFIINFLKTQADDFLKDNITTAVIGRPVIFDAKPEKDQLAQERLSKAVQSCGFEKLYFQMEPIAAAFTYERQLSKNELVLVGDFGGGTSDFTLMHLKPQSINQANRSLDMISKGGIYVGGDNFDSKIMWHKITPHFGRGVKEKFALDNWLALPNTYFHHISSWEQMNFLSTVKMLESIKRSYIFSDKNPKVKNLLTLIEQNLGYSLFQKIEATKIMLSDLETANFHFNQKAISIEETITLTEFTNQIIASELQQIENYVTQYLKDNQLNEKDIDSVFLTGGSSMVKPLKEIFYEKFGREKIRSGDNFNSVATGLAYSYQIFKNS